MSARACRSGLLAGSILAALVAGAGCATKNPHEVGSFARGSLYEEKGKFQLAAEAYGAFIRQNPIDEQAAEAQYRKAMCYLEIKEYPLAAVEFQILQKDYPVSPLVEDAMFREGEAYLRQVGRVERDVSGAVEARAHFLRFLRQYPESRYLEEVRGYLDDIADLLVRKRLQAADVYAKLGRWQAVALTYDSILAEEPGSTLLPQVLWGRAQVAVRLDDPDTAGDLFRRLLNEYPDSPQAKRARRALVALEQGRAVDDDDDLGP